jgi:hypothetical protein
MSKQEDLDFLHPDVGQYVRLPMDQVADPARRDKWVSSKARPEQLYLRPEYPLNAQGRRMFRWMAFVSHETHPKMGPFVKAAVACSLPALDMAASATGLKYEPPKPKPKPKKSKKRKSPEPSSEKEAAAAPRAKVKAKARARSRSVSRSHEPGGVEAKASLRV